MKYQLIASVMIPAIASPTGWVRTATVFHISVTTPVWMVRIINEYSTHPK